MLLKELYYSAQKQLRDAGVEQPGLDARLLLQHALHLSHEKFISSQEISILPDQITAAQQFILRREKREPVSKILGYREFWKHRFAVSPATLDPRPDSEAVIEMVLSLYPERSAPLRVLELGAGSGCLLLSVLAEYPHAVGVGVDINLDALVVCRENAKALGLESRCQWLQSNWFEHVEGQFDLIISNPPYIVSTEIASLEPEVSQHEPHLALDGGKDGLDAYRAIIAQLSTYLSKDAWVIFEIGQGQEKAVSDLLAQQGCNVIEYHKDLSCVVRVVAGQFMSN